MKLEPLSVVVLRIFPRISSSECISFRALANASNVCEPLSCLQARSAEHMVRLSGSSQCAVTPMKLLLLVDQRSVVVSGPHGLSHCRLHCFGGIINHRAQGQPSALGCSSFTTSLKGSCSTTQRGWSPWTTCFTAALSMTLWDTVQLFTNVVCLLLDGGSQVLLLFVDVSSPYFLRWCACFLWNSESVTTSETGFKSYPTTLTVSHHELWVMHQLSPSLWLILNVNV